MDFPRRRVFARLTRVEQIGDSGLARLSLEFDTVNSERGDAAAKWIQSASSAEDENFGLLRVVTTARRFEDLVNAPPQLWHWYELELTPDHRDGGLLSWFAQLTPSGYTARSRGRTRLGRRLVAPDEASPLGAFPLGAAVTPQPTLPAALASTCAPANGAHPLAAYDVLSLVPQASAVIVHDVGQASFCTLTNEAGEALLHFDVGAPTAFNRHTAPPGPIRFQVGTPPPVVLSHWDWDHLGAVFLIDHLNSAPWIVPDQGLGPGAARLAARLARQGCLHLWPGGVTRFSFGQIGECLGTGRNDSGLAALVELSKGRNVLLTGDAGYDSIPGKLTGSGVDALVATHHGARPRSIADHPPVPRAPDPAYVISYGRRNVYRHPHRAALRSHRSWGAAIVTAGRRGAPRGDRRL